MTNNNLMNGAVIADTTKTGEFIDMPVNMPKAKKPKAKKVTVRNFPAVTISSFREGFRLLDGLALKQEGLNNTLESVTKGIGAFVLKLYGIALFNHKSPEYRAFVKTFTGHGEAMVAGGRDKSKVDNLITQWRGRTLKAAALLALGDKKMAGKMPAASLTFARKKIASYTSKPRGTKANPRKAKARILDDASSLFLFCSKAVPADYNGIKPATMKEIILALDSIILKVGGDPVAILNKANA